MLVLEQDPDVSQVSRAAVQVPEDCYAMVDSGTNAVIVRLHANMRRDIAECKVTSSMVHGPIVQGGESYPRIWGV